MPTPSPNSCNLSHRRPAVMIANASVESRRPSRSSLFNATCKYATVFPCLESLDCLVTRLARYLPKRDTSGNTLPPRTRTLFSCHIGRVLAVATRKSSCRIRKVWIAWSSVSPIPSEAGHLWQYLATAHTQLLVPYRGSVSHRNTQVLMPHPESLDCSVVGLARYLPKRDALSSNTLPPRTHSSCRAVSGEC
ncbi:hypothetical protein VTI74DRAFT_659 [Chaetomium olivicolor]